MKKETVKKIADSFANRDGWTDKGTIQLFTNRHDRYFEHTSGARLGVGETVWFSFEDTMHFFTEEEQDMFRAALRKPEKVRKETELEELNKRLMEIF